MNGIIDVLVTLEFAFILALLFGLGLGLDLGLELGFTLVHNILLDGAIRYICALRMEEVNLTLKGLNHMNLKDNLTHQGGA